MKRIYKHLYKKEKGFTLVELMVVVIIIAVLTGIAIPSYFALRNRARSAAAQSEMKNIGTAIELYAIDNGNALPAALANIEGTYIAEVPDADPWGVGYVYAVNGGSYTLTCYGPDGEADGGDDIVLTDGQF